MIQATKHRGWDHASRPDRLRVECHLTASAYGSSRVQTAQQSPVLNGISRALRAGAPWRDLPERYGPYTTAYNRFNRWRKAGI
jgi:transposase